MFESPEELILKTATGREVIRVLVRPTVHCLPMVIVHGSDCYIRVSDDTYQRTHGIATEMHNGKWVAKPIK